VPAIIAAPVNDNAITNSIAHTGETTHKKPTDALEMKSPIPLTVAKTPKPTTRTEAGSIVAAVVFSGISQTPVRMLGAALVVNSLIRAFRRKLAGMASCPAAAD
jgi:hypothetical protein